jgi:hypothetical protein
MYVKSIPSDVTSLLRIHKLPYMFRPIMAIIRGFININWKHCTYSQYMFIQESYIFKIIVKDKLF